MAIYRILQNVAFEPDQIEILVKAYESTLRALGFSHRLDPRTERIAKIIIELAQAGERDPARLRVGALAALGLTASIENSTEETSGAAQEKSDPNSRKTLLLVEDDEIFAYAASRYFEGMGYTTLVASGSHAAFRALENHSVDIVIADIRLGEEEPHGIALGRMIRNRDLNMPIVLVTAYPDLLKKEGPLPGPAFTKPVDLGLLASTVKAVLPH